VLDQSNKPDAGSLDDLLWPNGIATMHDAVLVRLTIDYAAAAMTMALRVHVGDPDSDNPNEREAYRAGTLRVVGLAALSIEPPDKRWRPGRNAGLWIDADLGDPGGDAAADRAVTLGRALDAEIRFWIYSHEWNSFIRVTCSDVAFEWADTADGGG
jgi:hypothetical protein